MAESLAGAATADITPATGVPMGGYGARRGTATAVMDPLLVRAVVLSDGTEPVALAVCDLLGVGSDLVAEARAGVEAACGIPADRVLVGATHTHSGPAGFRPADDPHYVAVTAAKIAGAVAEAHRRLQPVTLKAGTVTVGTVSQNRRDPEGPLETTARVLLADTPQPAGPVATLVNFACHATVLEQDNLELSPDWPGAMARFVERELGGTAVFLQGAAGDVNPVWSRHDRHDVERVGGIVGAAATRLAHEMRPLDAGQWCINLSWSEHVPVPATGFLAGPLSLGAARRVLELPRRERRLPEEVAADLEVLQGDHDAVPEADTAGRRRLRARINELSTARLLAGAGRGRPTQAVEVQALRLTESCGVVSLPGEFFVETGEEIARRCGLPFLLVAGYSNGSVGYVPPARAFPEAGYEVGMTQFGPDAEGAVVDAAVDLVRSLY